MVKNKLKTQVSYQIVTLLCAAVVLLAITVAAVLMRPPVVISNFEQCKKAGGALMESYPEQCMINKTSFTNTTQQQSNDGYIGLTESEALAKAEKSNTPARVVERDGQALPVTMDFAFGRHNFYVKEGKVYKVDVEGQATDN